MTKKVIWRDYIDRLSQTNTRYSFSAEVLQRSKELKFPDVISHTATTVGPLSMEDVRRQMRLMTSPDCDEGYIPTFSWAGAGIHEITPIHAPAASQIRKWYDWLMASALISTPLGIHLYDTKRFSSGCYGIYFPRNTIGFGGTIHLPCRGPDYLFFNTPRPTVQSARQLIFFHEFAHYEQDVSGQPFHEAEADLRADELSMLYRLEMGVDF